MAAGPARLAVTPGRLTCRVCTRELTRPDSRARGIGPVCAAREQPEPPKTPASTAPSWPRWAPREYDPRQVEMWPVQMVLL